MKKLLAFVLLLFIFSGCAEEKVSGGEPVIQETEAVIEEHYCIPSASDFQGTAVFELTPDGFRDYFNSISEIELYEINECEKEKLAPCGHFENGVIRYIFKIVPDMQNSPSITLYTPYESKSICEVTVDFDDHAFSTDAMALYKEMCLDIMSMFSEIEDKEDIYLELVEYADENVSTVNFLDSSRRDIIYSDDNAAFCSYFAYGEYSHICIIPVH